MIDWTGSPPFGRRTSLMHTLEILDARRPAWATILEIGTSESYNPDGLGNAMLAFCWYAGRYGAKVKSVDVQNVANSQALLRQFVRGYAAIPEFHLMDAFDFVPTLHEPIGLTYMDAGFELACDPQYKTFARRFADRIPSWYVELFRLFDPECFQPGALMLFDDTDPASFMGKGMHLIPHLLENGWRHVELRGEPVFPMVLLELS